MDLQYTVGSEKSRSLLGGESPAPDDDSFVVTSLLMTLRRPSNLHDLKISQPVRLHGLKRVKFNSHVATVVGEASSENDGNESRIAIALHELSEYGLETCASPLRIAVKAANLAPLRLRRAIPSPGIPPERCAALLGSLSPHMISRLLRELLPLPLPSIIANFLTLPFVDISEVRVRGASSTRGDFPLDVVLNPTDNWWISADGTMKEGVGHEHLTFVMAPSHDSKTLALRRVSMVGIRIPPLPYGPLSVRRFEIWSTANPSSDLMDDSKGIHDWPGWKRASLELQTLDQAELQWFALDPPVDATALRLVCCSNAGRDSHVLRDEEGNNCENQVDGEDDEIEESIAGNFYHSCVGLFQVSFA